MKISDAVHELIIVGLAAVSALFSAAAAVVAFWTM